MSIFEWPLKTGFTVSHYLFQYPIRILSRELDHLSEGSDTHHTATCTGPLSSHVSLAY